MYVDKQLEGNSKTKGFDAATGKVCDFIEAGIIDPTKVVRCAIVNSAGVASLMITSEAVVVEEAKQEKEHSHKPPNPMEDAY